MVGWEQWEMHIEGNGGATKTSTFYLFRKHSNRKGQLVKCALIQIVTHANSQHWKKCQPINSVCFKNIKGVTVDISAE